MKPQGRVSEPHPAPQRLFTHRFLGCHDPCPLRKGAQGLRRAGGWRYWEGSSFTVAWLPVGLPCQLDGHMSSWPLDPVPP